jgi:hypothetical protein
MTNFQEEPNNQLNKVDLIISYFSINWSLENDENKFVTLKTLILNFCYVDLKIVQCLLERLTNLNELHLTSNNYSHVTFSDSFLKESLQILYFNNNNLTDWHEVFKFAKFFPNLENLVLSENSLGDLNLNDEKNCTNLIQFSKLKAVNLNKLDIKNWSTIDHFRTLFPNLKNIRIKDIPLLIEYAEDLKTILLLSHLNETIEVFNGSLVTNEQIEEYHRKYLNYYIDKKEKPERFSQLQEKSLNLRNFEQKVTIKIKFEEKQQEMTVDLKQTVGDLKKSLETFVGIKSSCFKLFYINQEALFGHGELKLMKKKLFALKIKQGDQFEIFLEF